MEVDEEEPEEAEAEEAWLAPPPMPEPAPAAPAAPKPRGRVLVPPQLYACDIEGDYLTGDRPHRRRRAAPSDALPAVTFDGRRLNLKLDSASEAAAADASWLEGGSLGGGLLGRPIEQLLEEAGRAAEAALLAESARLQAELRALAEPAGEGAEAAAAAEATEAAPRSGPPQTELWCALRHPPPRLTPAGWTNTRRASSRSC